MGSEQIVNDCLGYVADNQRFMSDCDLKALFLYPVNTPERP